MLLPGNLTEMTPQAAADFRATLASTFASAVNSANAAYRLDFPGLQTTATRIDDPDLALPLTVDWPAHPIRFERAVGTERAEAFLADHGPRALFGRLGHEEYVEWHDVRDAQGRLVRVDMTTESREYWLSLARYQPQTVLDLMGAFAGEGPAPWELVYGPGPSNDPFAPGRTPDERGKSFADFCFGNSPRVLSPYNNGEKAIAFMGQSVNTIGAAIGLAAFGAVPIQALGQNRPLTGPELIATGLTRGSAVDCRNSDPLIVSRAIAAAGDGRKISFLDPIGIYVKQTGRGTGPFLPGTQTPVPDDWWHLSRGGEVTVDGITFPLTQRVSFQVPEGAGVRLDELEVDGPGGRRRIDSGLDLIRMLRIAFYLTLSDRDVVGQPPVHLPPPASVAACADPAYVSNRDLRRLVERWEQDKAGSPAAPFLSRGGA